MRPSLILLLMLAGCTRSAPRGFDAAAPEGRIDAIVQAARTSDRSAIPHLVASLDADDPAVRFLAISALEHMTGQTFDYRFEAPPDERARAVTAWQQWTIAEGIAPATKEASRP
ncbi:MAG: hypothetical protein KF866_03285 [Phycisphaeraceae bacterium]|nr:hypothetical protein [Phycisphaeraceae bacterium]MCW5753280.1 hypothetical protein [Phycisphaeraceae bacterium]